MSLVPRSKLLRAGLAASGVAAIAAAAPTSRVSLLVVALLCLLPVVTSLSQAGRVAPICAIAGSEKVTKVHGSARCGEESEAQFGACWGVDRHGFAMSHAVDRR